MHLRLLVGVVLFATLLGLVCSAPPSPEQPVGHAIQDFSRRQTPPKGALPPKPKTPKPKAAITLASTVQIAKATIKKLLDEMEGGEPPVIDGGVELSDDPIYPSGAEAKIRKVEAPKGPETGTACAGEECLDSASCVHMAGRRYHAMWFTCCANGLFADFHGKCCTKKLNAKHHFCP